ncbi:microtubule-associated protein RP/EB family member 1-like [Accipiter gentilis]|uniref:microtubule-associated protein RP/EB family member 1-like n=1 Tax=Astur gentilis TaxID=8957 RepID=UPI00211010D0|nr:microtubule-associated protein RP/EB family member 1-like [Accipiter gentilis]
MVFENFEKFEYSWGVGTSTVLALLLGISILLNVVQLSFKVKQLFKKITQRCAPRLDNYEWQGVWGSMGKYLEKWAPPTFWKFTPEQVQDPEELVKYLEKVCCHPGSSREIQITATCWGLAHAYRALFDTTQYPQGEEKVSRPNNKMMSTVATQTSTMGTAAPPGLARSISGTQTLATGTVTPPAPATRTRATQTSTTGTAAPPAPAMSTAATQTLATSTVVPPAPPTSTAATQTSATDTAVIQNSTSDTATEPEDQPGPESVAPIQKRKYTKKSVRLAKDEGEPGSSREPEEEAEPEVITRSLSLSELRDLQKDFGRHIGEHIITWLL